MMTNKFSVRPANILPGVQALNTGIGNRIEFEIAKAKESDKQVKREKAAEIITKGTPDEIAAFSIKNPWIIGDVNTAIGFKSELTKANAIESAKRILMGAESATEVALDRAEFVIKQGGDASGTMDLIAKGQKDPQAIKAEAEKILALNAPKEYQSWKLLTSQSTEAIKDRRTSAIKDYEYAKQTDNFTGTFLDFKKKFQPDRFGEKQKTGAYLVRNKSGDEFIAVGSFDKNTGKLTTETSPLGGLDVVSKLGETAQEESNRKVQQKRGEAGAIESEKRASDLIERGILAAESTATLRRGIQLLGSVKTGGFASVKFAVKRFFGVEGADEGELSNSLGKAILGQLRETFGAQFTEREGARLDRIEANFSKSPANNLRLLNQTLSIATRTARRAKKAALKRGDRETAADIDALLKYELTSDPIPTADTAKKKNHRNRSLEELEAIARGEQ